MEFLHSMIRITNIDASLKFFCDGLGLTELRRVDNEAGRFTLIFLASPDDIARSGLIDFSGSFPAGLPMIELTHNWPEDGKDGEIYNEGRNFGHLAYRVNNIYETCQNLLDMGYAINRPPRDGYMAFVRSPDNISIELLQSGTRLPAQAPWDTMENTGHW